MTKKETVVQKQDTDLVQFKSELQTLNRQVGSITIKDAESFKKASILVMRIDDYEKKVHAFTDENIDKAHKLWKSLLGSRTELIDPAERIKKLLRKGMSDYTTEQVRLKREEDARLEAERKASEEAERNKLLRQAEKAEDRGNSEKAEALREKAEEVFIPTIITAPEIEKTTHIANGTVSQVADIDLQVNDAMAVIKAVADGKIPVLVIEIKEAKLKKYAKDYKLKEIPGCTITEKMDIRIRQKSA